MYGVVYGLLDEAAEQGWTSESSERKFVLGKLTEMANKAGVPMKWQQAQAVKWLSEATAFAHARIYFELCECDMEQFADWLINECGMDQAEGLQVVDFVQNLSEHLEHLNELQERDTANQATVRGHGVVNNPLNDVDKLLLKRAFGDHKHLNVLEAPHSKRNYEYNGLDKGKSFTSADDIRKSRKPGPLQDSKVAWYADQITKAAANRIWK
jgi:hypothetical protein